MKQKQIEFSLVYLLQQMLILKDVFRESNETKRGILTFVC